MNERFFTIDEFNDNFYKEIKVASDVYERRVASGMKEYSLAIFDFIYVSDTKEKLDSLSEFLTGKYGYKIKELKRVDNKWELTGDATEFPVSKENLEYWALDLYWKGYEFDCKLDAYGALADPYSQKLPEIDTSKASEYFQQAMTAYNNRNFGMTFIHLSTSLRCDSSNPNTWYSRGIVKADLELWKSARNDYDRAIEIAPAFAPAFANRGALKDDAGEYELALHDYDKAISIDPNNSIAYFNRGNTKYRMGNQSGACLDWSKALELGAEYAKENIVKYCKE